MFNQTTPPTPDKLAEARELFEELENSNLLLDVWKAGVTPVYNLIQALLKAQDLVSRAEQKEEDARIARLSSSCCEHEDPTCAEIIAKKILNS